MRKPLLVILISLCQAIAANAGLPVSYRAEAIANAGSGDFAPYYVTSNNFGILTSPGSALLRLSAIHPMSTGQKFSFGFGVDAVTGYASSIDYLKYNSEELQFNQVARHPARIRLQQLYGEVKYRCLFLNAGLKQTGSALLNDRLSSGDITWSANARPMPGARAGFWRFENIPFTNGWVQINGELFYGRPTDNDWLLDHYNYYNSFVTTGRWINYKRVYFRTKPSQPVSVTVGMQAAAQFVGTQSTYDKGALSKTASSPLKLKDFFEMLIPQPGDDFWKGNHLGSWDMMARLRLKNGNEVKAYFQWPWEDGSGIGKLNGFDGLWGVEFSGRQGSIVEGIVVEYLDFTNQSGPLHWDPADMAGTTITNQATGSDSYYNNYFYNGYAYYGLSQGTPFLKSPFYNRDGYLQYVDTRVRGFHLAMEGALSRALNYRIMVSHRRSLGDSYIPRLKKVTDTSWLAEIAWHTTVPGLDLKGQLAMDRGKMYGNNFGAMVSVSYSGLINLNNR